MKPVDFWKTALVTVFTLLLFGAPSAAFTPPADSTVRTDKLFDGFEGKQVAPFWRPGNYGEGRYAPGAVTISTDRVRSGARSIKITVQKGDGDQEGDGGTRTERAELDSGAHSLIGRDAWYRLAFLVPRDFPVVDNRLVFAQWKQSSLRGGPLVAQRYRAGRHYLTVRTTATGRADRQHPLPSLTHDHWHDMVYHIRFSAGADGLVEVWMDGKKVVTHQGPTAFEPGKPTIYNKIGLYRDRWETPMTLYFDDYAFGDSRDAIDRFDRKP